MIEPATLYGTIRELGRGLREGRYSSVELARAYMDRLRGVGRRLNAVVTVTEDRALEAARRADRELAEGRDRGPLHGIPYGVKDLVAARGAPTTWGADPYRDQEFDHDATVVRRLDEAGGVLVAKLASVELAGGMGYDQADASFTGPGRNPWNPDAWSGGSSAGPGSAVAAGAVGFAIGTETWGSITTPSAFCGLSGLRPTYGRVSRHGAMALSWTMDKLGPMCRSADDAGLVLRAVAGPDPRDETAADRPYPETPAELGSDVRLAVLRGTGEEEQPAVRKNFARSMDVLRELAAVEEIELPDHPYGAVAGTVIDAEAASAFGDLVESGRIHQLTAPEDRLGGYPQQAVLARDYIDAMRIRKKIQRDLDEALAPYDAVVGPTLAVVANPIEEEFGPYFGEWGGPSMGAAANAAGLPGITVPNGFGERGLPTSLGFTGRAWDEPKLLALARAYQERTDWHRRHPEL